MRIEHGQPIDLDFEWCSQYHLDRCEHVRDHVDDFFGIGYIAVYYCGGQW